MVREAGLPCWLTARGRAVVDGFRGYYSMYSTRLAVVVPRRGDRSIHGVYWKKVTTINTLETSSSHHLYNYQKSTIWAGPNTLFHINLNGSTFHSPYNYSQTFPTVGFPRLAAFPAHVNKLLIGIFPVADYNDAARIVSTAVNIPTLLGHFYLVILTC